MSGLFARKGIFAAICLAALLATGQSSFGVVTYFESGGMVVGEGEIFTARSFAADGQTTWLVRPTENAGTANADGGPIIANARGGAYVQTSPDNQSGGVLNGDPFIQYNIQIETPGTYRLFLRWDGNNTNGTTRGQSDSMFANILQLSDGPGGTIADHYEFSQSVNGDFASPAWDGGAGFEQNQPNSTNDPALWAITTPGTYTLQFTQREDGAAVDAWVLQLETLAAPTGDGPAISRVADIPEPATATLGLIALAGLARRRRRAC